MKDSPVKVRDNRPNTRDPELIENGPYERFTGQDPRQSAKYEISGSDNRKTDQIKQKPDRKARKEEKS
jgi:hypothetical protein